MITTDFIGGSVGVATYTLAFAIGAPASIGVSVDRLSSDLFVMGFHATAILGIFIGIAAQILSWLVPKSSYAKENLQILLLFQIENSNLSPSL